MRCVNYHNFAERPCPQCKIRKRNRALLDGEKRQLRKDLIKKFEGTELEYLTDRIK